MTMMVGMPFPGEVFSIARKETLVTPQGTGRCFAQCSQGAFVQLLHFSMHLRMQRDMGGKRP